MTNSLTSNEREVDISEVIDTCEVEWEHPKNSMCGTHSCELIKYHEGPHVCSCGWKRRLMYRDEPERFDERLR